MDYVGYRGASTDEAVDWTARRVVPMPLPAKRVVLSILVPVKDEEEAVGPFVARLAPILDEIVSTRFPGDDWEILFVDDGSRDSTMAAIRLAHARDPRVRAIALSRNFGKEAALSAALDHAAGA